MQQTYIICTFCVYKNLIAESACRYVLYNQVAFYGFCIAQRMIVAGGAIGYGREIGDVLTGVGGGIDMSAMEESRILGVSVAQLVKKMRKW